MIIHQDKKVTNYFPRRTLSGLRVFDISDIHNNVFEVGKYETYRDPDGDDNFDEQIKGNY